MTHKTPTGRFNNVRFGQLRYAKNITMREMAQMVGVSEAIISYWEAGKHSPRLKRAQMVARIFRIPLRDLYLTEEDTQ